MYSGNNPIAIRSQECLSDALLDLMKENDYSKISIKDICGTAGLSRQTFYQFFNSKDDVIRFTLIKKLGYIEVTDDIRKFANILFSFIDKNRCFLKLLIDKGLESLLTQELAFEISKRAHKYFMGVDETLKRYAYVFIANALSGTIIYWLEEPNSISKSELITLLFQIIEGKYFNNQMKQ